jgi:subtilisin family serine protease
VTWDGQVHKARPDSYLVGFNDIKGGDADAQVRKANEKLAKGGKGYVAKRQLGADGVFELKAPAGKRADEVRNNLAKLPGVAFVEPDFVVTTEATPANDTYYAGYQWGLNNTGQTGGTSDADIDAPEAWDLTRGDGSVVVGVIDSGVDWTHPDLAANVWINPGEVAGDGIDNDANGYVDDVRGWDFFNRDNNPMDDNGHGTHVAGTIAASGNNGTGVAGVSWNAKVVPLKFMGADGSGYLSDAGGGVNYATNMMHAASTSA